MLFTFIVRCLAVCRKCGRILVATASGEVGAAAVGIGTKLVAVFARFGGIAGGRETKQAREVSSNERSDSSYCLICQHFDILHNGMGCFLPQPPKMPRFSSMQHHIKASVVAPTIKLVLPLIAKSKACWEEPYM